MQHTFNFYSDQKLQYPLHQYDFQSFDFAFNDKYKLFCISALIGNRRPCIYCVAIQKNTTATTVSSTLQCAAVIGYYYTAATNSVQHTTSHFAAVKIEFYQWAKGQLLKVVYS